jgi:DNA polymerase III delta prime subunit
MNLSKVQETLDFFYQKRRIPHIIFHGPSGSGKKTIVHQFLEKIYGNDKAKMKSNIMFVNCAHGKGIKFIREELKFFAKTNIQISQGILFKTIILLNADYLTIDAQSALRRCIELFSNNTRFFIIVENKDKLLKPILSRFCDLYIQPSYDVSLQTTVNLHQVELDRAFLLEDFKKERTERLHSILHTLLFKHLIDKTHKDLVKKVENLYEEGYSCIDIINWIKTTSEFSDAEKSEIEMVFYKIKSEYRCEKMLMFYIFDYAFLRKKKELKNISGI